MSRDRFKSRLAKISERRRTTPAAGAPEPLAQHEDAPWSVDFLLLALLGGAAVWLMYDFWRALPFVVLGGLALGAYSFARFLYLMATGQKRHSRRSPIWGFFEDMWF